MLSQNEAYEQKLELYKSTQKLVVPLKMNIPENINLGYISQCIRIKKFKNVYKSLLPILLQEAMAGKPNINITEEKKVNDIYLVADLLSKKLILTDLSNDNTSFFNRVRFSKSMMFIEKEASKISFDSSNLLRFTIVQCFFSMSVILFISLIIHLY